MSSHPLAARIRGSHERRHPISMSRASQLIKAMENSRYCDRSQLLDFGTSLPPACRSAVRRGGCGPPRTWCGCQRLPDFPIGWPRDTLWDSRVCVRTGGDTELHSRIQSAGRRRTRCGTRGYRVRARWEHGAGLVVQGACSMGTQCGTRGVQSVCSAEHCTGVAGTQCGPAGAWGWTRGYGVRSGPNTVREARVRSEGLPGTLCGPEGTEGGTRG